MTTSKLISKKELNKVYWRSCTLEGSWNYERMAATGFVYSLIPIIDKVYQNDLEKKKEALSRHLELMNITPFISTLLMGVCAAMEEQNSLSDEVDGSSITTVKTALMGPISGIGDSFFWGTLKVIASGIGIELASQGNILGPILFLLIFNIPAYLLRYFGLHWGYKFGTDFITKAEQSGVMDKITLAASVLGLMVIGGMTASMVNFTLPFQIGSGDTAVTVQSILDSILPNMLPLSLTLLVYYLFGKGVKSTTIIIGLILFGIILALF